MYHILHFGTRDPNTRQFRYIDSVVYPQNRYARYLKMAQLDDIDAEQDITEYHDGIVVVKEMAIGPFFGIGMLYPESGFFPCISFDNIDSALASGYQIFNGMTRTWVN